MWVDDITRQQVSMCCRKCKHEFLPHKNKRTKNNAAYWSKNYQKHVQYIITIGTIFCVAVILPVWYEPWNCVYWNAKLQQTWINKKIASEFSTTSQEVALLPEVRKYTILQCIPRWHRKLSSGYNRTIFLTSNLGYICTKTHKKTCSVHYYDRNYLLCCSNFTCVMRTIKSFIHLEGTDVLRGAYSWREERECIISILQMMKSVCMSMSEWICLTNWVEHSIGHNLLPIFVKPVINVVSAEKWLSIFLVEILGIYMSAKMELGLYFSMAATECAFYLAYRICFGFSSRLSAVD